MTNIDWSKAPEGTTDYRDNDSDVALCWYKISNNGAYEVYNHISKEWIGPIRPLKVITDELIPRPNPVYTQEMADNGELPSVGMAVGFKGSIDCCVIAIHNNQLWIDKGEIGTQIINIDQVQPIDQRTDKEKAIDDIYKSINKYNSSQGGCYDLLNDIINGKVHGVTFKGE